MTRIVFLITQDLESPGGLGRYGPLAKSLARLGHSVCIYGLHPNYAAHQQRKFIVEGVRVEYVAQEHIKKVGSKKIYFSIPVFLAVSLRATWALALAAFREPADIIYIGHPLPINIIPGILAARWKRCRLFIDFNDLPSVSSRFSQEWQRWIVSFFERAGARQADLVTMNATATQDWLVRRGVPPQKIIYLAEGVDETRFPPAQAEAIHQKRTELRLGDAPVVAYVGTMGLVEHPIGLLLEAFSMILKVKPEVRLLMVGGGESLDVLREQCHQLGIDGAVLFTGRVPPAQVAIYYQLAQASIDPVNDDAIARTRCPIKLFESWMCGVPFVSADVGDRCMLAGQPPAALLAKPGSPEHLAQAILEVLSNPSLAEELRQRGYLRVHEYTYDRMVAGLAALFS